MPSGRGACPSFGSRPAAASAARRISATWRRPAACRGRGPRPAGPFRLAGIAAGVLVARPSGCNLQASTPAPRRLGGSRHPLPGRDARAGREGDELRGPPRRGRSGRTGPPLLRRRGRRTGVSRHHGHLRPAADRGRVGLARRGCGEHPLHHRRRGPRRRGRADAARRRGRQGGGQFRGRCRSAVAGSHGRANWARANVVCAIDARRKARGWTVLVRGGRDDAGIDALAWAEEAVRRGAGELL